MYNQIARTAWQARPRPSPAAFRGGVRLLFLLLLLLAGLSFSYDRTTASASLQLESLPLIQLDAVERILVIAPHPDDETLGGAGLIQAALAQGRQVKVVVVTNGDGQALAPLLLDRTWRARAHDFVLAGERRQAETVEAVGLLGLPADDVIFLGYPDGRLEQLWLNDWGASCPFWNRYTRASASPYPLTFNHNATYCGRDLLDDLLHIIAEFRPDLILLPHPNDDHADHRATTSFAMMALGIMRQADPDYRPQAWGYLIHYGLYPQKRGFRPSEPLLPPRPLTAGGIEWRHLTLTPGQREAKAAAINAYDSQIRLMRSFLLSFARQAEVFVPVRPLLLAPTAAVQLPVLEPSHSAPPQLPEAAGERSRQRLLAGADLVALHAEWTGDQLRLAAQTRGPLFPGLRYRLLIKLPDGDTVVASWPGTAVRDGRDRFSFTFDLAGHGDPSVLCVAAEVRQGGILDRTGWHSIILDESAP